MSSSETLIEAPVWPELSHNEKMVLGILNIGSFFVAYIIFRIIWRPPTDDEISLEKQFFEELAAAEQAVRQKEEYKSYGAVEKQEDAESGKVMGDYSADWTTTYDMTLTLMMVFFLAVLVAWTTFVYPQLWYDPWFWIMQLPKLAVMMGVAILGGLACRHYIPGWENNDGYITGSKSLDENGNKIKNGFRVNYTRKFQHFAAYMVPLVVTYKSPVTGPIVDAWGDWFTMFAFWLLIKPIRERCGFFMLQFNSLDRPEDRPYTLQWIIGYNILPGLFMIIFWRWMLSFSGQEDLAYIFIFITGIGDGLAEPVGIAWGTHKYYCSAIGGTRRYQRSFEGSCCLWIGTLIFTTMFWYAFDNALQFWVTMIVLPPMMTYAEAKSPHTADTPFLMGLGGLTLWLVSHLQIEWIQ